MALVSELASGSALVWDLDVGVRAEGAADDPPHATSPNSNRQQNHHTPTTVRRVPTRCDNIRIPTTWMRNRRLGVSGVYLKK